MKKLAWILAAAGLLVGCSSWHHNNEGGSGNNGTSTYGGANSDTNSMSQ